MWAVNSLTHPEKGQAKRNVRAGSRCCKWHIKRATLSLGCKSWEVAAHRQMKHGYEPLWQNGAKLRTSWPISGWQERQVGWTRRIFDLQVVPPAAWQSWHLDLGQDEGELCEHGLMAEVYGSSFMKVRDNYVWAMFMAPQESRHRPASHGDSKFRKNEQRPRREAARR